MISRKNLVIVEKFERDVEKMGDLYETGYQEMNAHIEELKAYLTD